MRNVKLLLIEDDQVDRLAFERWVREERLQYQCTLAESVREAQAALSREPFDIIVADYKLGDGDVFDILGLKLDIQTIITTGAGNEEVAVRAMKAGACDYLIKDLDRNYLKVLPVAVERALGRKKTEERLALLKEKDSEDAFLAGGAGLEPTLKLIDLAASTDSPVFITGETGTGKNRVAKAIHYRSVLRTAPFIGINCAALPESLIESELFGHEKGAFTGAVAAKKGVFELAEGGTLLLDEIGEMPVHLQSKLLGVLDDKQIRRLGSESARPVDTRVICATSVDLEHALGKTFRQDLFFRLSVIRIPLPPLRERRADIPDLVRHLVRKLNDGKDVPIPDAELQRLQQYSWPGNVRELKNILERSLIVADGSPPRPSEFLGAGPGAEPCPAFTEPTPAGAVSSLEELEKRHIQMALGRFGGNITQTAKALGISISTLKRKKKLYALG